MDPTIFDTSSGWSNLWFVASAIYITVWVLAAAIGLAAAAVVPYLVTKAMTKRQHAGIRSTTSRAIIPAALAVIVLMAAAVVGTAYAAGALK